MVASTINNVGGDMSEMVASVSTTRRHRKSMQTETASRIKEQTKQTMPKSKIVHWDGKITKMITKKGYKKKYINAVVISGPEWHNPNFLVLRL